MKGTNDTNTVSSVYTSQDISNIKYHYTYTTASNPGSAYQYSNIIFNLYKLQYILAYDIETFYLSENFTYTYISNSL